MGQLVLLSYAICFQPLGKLDVLQYKQSHRTNRGITDVYAHTGSANTKRIFIPFFYSSTFVIIKLTKIFTIKKKERKEKEEASWHCQLILVVVLEILIR